MPAIDMPGLGLGSDSRRFGDLDALLSLFGARWGLRLHWAAARPGLRRPLRCVRFCYAREVGWTSGCSKALGALAPVCYSPEHSGRACCLYPCRLPSFTFHVWARAPKTPHKLRLRGNHPKCPSLPFNFAAEYLSRANSQDPKAFASSHACLCSVWRPVRTLARIRPHRVLRPGMLSPQRRSGGAPAPVSSSPSAAKAPSEWNWPQGPLKLSSMSLCKLLNICHL